MAGSLRDTLLHKSLASISFEISRTLQRVQSIDSLDTPPLTDPSLTHPSLTPQGHSSDSGEYQSTDPSLPQQRRRDDPTRDLPLGGTEQGHSEQGERGGGGEGVRSEVAATDPSLIEQQHIKWGPAQWQGEQEEAPGGSPASPAKGAPWQRVQQPQGRQHLLQQKLLGGLGGQVQQPGGNRASSMCTLRVGPTFPLKTIQAALDAVGQNPISAPVAICISAGVYPEYIRVRPGQDNIRLIGQGPNTVITGNRSLGQVNNTFLAATLIIEGEFFIARNIRIQNSYYSVSDPAPAVTILSHTTRWYNSTIEAWGDTVAIYRGANHLFSRCVISGVTDMTWGFGRAAFVDTTFYVRKFVQNGIRYSGNIATFGTGPSSEGITAGAILWNCTIDGPGTTYLGRPYRPETITVFAHCYMGNAVLEDGWNAFRHNLEANQYNFVEYDSRGPGAKKLRKYGKVFLGEPPRKFTVTAFLQRQ